MSIRTVSELLLDLRKKFKTKTVSVEKILLAFHERGFGFFLFIVALPMALPLPVPPGINILLATPLLLLTGQQAIGRKTIWVPEKLRKKRIDIKTLQDSIDKALPVTKKIEVFIQPRLGFITQGIFSNIIGAAGFVMALAVCVPVPLTNTVPSLGIALMAIGVVMRDGLTVLTGLVVGSLWVLMLVFIVVFLGTEGIEVFKETIKALLHI